MINVLITDAKRGAGWELAKLLRANGQFHLIEVEASVRNYDDLCAELYEKAKDCCSSFAKSQSIEVVVNCSGVRRGFAMQDFDVHRYNEVIATNLTGSLNVFRAAHPFMRRAKGNKLFFNLVGDHNIEDPESIATLAARGGSVSVIDWLGHHFTDIEFVVAAVDNTSLPEDDKGVAETIYEEIINKTLGEQT